MRLCLVAGEYPPMQGGLGDYTRELARALCALGVDVSVVTARRGTATQTATETGIRVFPVVDGWGWRCWRQIGQVCQQTEADIVHVQYQTAAYGMYPAINLWPLWLRLAGRRLHSVITYHDLRVPYLFPKAGSLRRYITEAPAHWYEAAIFTNDEDFHRLAPRSRRPYLIPIGSNIAVRPPAGYDRAAWRARLGVQAHEFLLAYFGFLNESKGGATLVRTLAELAQQGRPVRLLMVGGQVGDSDPTNVAYLAHVKELMGRLGVDKRVQWTGFAGEDEVSAHLLAADAALLPYRDGASYRRGSLMAALAHGLPVVSTQGAGSEAPTSGGLPTLVNGDNVLLAPPESPAALAQAVVRLMDDAPLRQRLAGGASALSRAFAWDAIARTTERVYTTVIAGATPVPQAAGHERPG